MDVSRLAAQCSHAARGAHRTSPHPRRIELSGRSSLLWADNTLPSLVARASLVASFAAELRLLGPANFLYSDGDALFAHGDRRIQGASGRIAPPSLWILQRHCPPSNPSPERNGDVAVTQDERAALLIASVPLTDEAWRPLSEGKLVVVRDGAMVSSLGSA